MTFDPQLQQAAETSHFKLDEQGFIEGSLVDFLNLGFEKNKAIILSDPRHDLSSGLFQALADPKVMKLLSDKHVKFTAEIPEDYQDYLNAYKKSGDIKDLGDKIPSQMLPFLEAARKYGIDVVAIDLKSTERPMADRFYQVKDEFKLDQKMAAAFI